MNPETFTLGALFKMGLHNFEESISEIVTAAVKEMSIEKGLKEVADVWDNEKFRRVFKQQLFSYFCEKFAPKKSFQVTKTNLKTGSEYIPLLQGHIRPWFYFGFSR